MWGPNKGRWLVLRAPTLFTHVHTTTRHNHSRTHVPMGEPSRHLAMPLKSSMNRSAASCALTTPTAASSSRSSGAAVLCRVHWWVCLGGWLTWADVRGFAMPEDPFRFQTTPEPIELTGGRTGPCPRPPQQPPLHGPLVPVSVRKEKAPADQMHAVVGHSPTRAISPL